MSFISIVVKGHCWGVVIAPTGFVSSCGEGPFWKVKAMEFLTMDSVSAGVSGSD